MEWGKEVKLLELKGRDRDKLIAIKRNMQSDVDCAMFSVPHWSTDRNDAWELWDDLPMKYRKMVLDEWSAYYLFEAMFPQIVSETWLRWYYNYKWSGGKK